MVETPGTAPGSTTLIPRSVYRHSQGANPSCTDKYRSGALLWQGLSCMSMLLGQNQQAFKITHRNVKHILSVFQS